jgi:predicted ATP-binding protein involved in virulence
MKIRKLHLKNIGVFDDETIEFKECPAKDKAEIHILTGENGTGKTTILQGLASLFLNTILNEDIKTGAFALHRNLLIKKIHHYSDTKVKFELIHKGVKKEFSFGINLLGNYGHILHPFDYDFNNVIDKDLRNYSVITNSENEYISELTDEQKTLEFVALAYSGYRRIKDESIEIGKESIENPLHQALDFVKNENSKFTVNQWLGRNLSKRALALEDNSENANKFTKNIQNLEKTISEIIGYEIRFKLKIDLSLVLIKDNQELDFDVLPDGLKSLISWIGDLLMRLDSLQWKDDTPIFDREIILFLDEIEVHLHPAWQRKVLPIVQKLFKNAQIFVSTHSPFVVNSVDDAWVYELEVKDGKAKVREVTQSNTAYSIQTVLREVFDISKQFGDGFDEKGTQKKLIKFLDKSKHIQRNNGKSEISKEDFLKLAVDLAERSAELQSIVFVELAKLTQKTGEKYEI